MIRIEIPHEKILCEEVAIFMLTAKEVADSAVLDNGTFVLFFEDKENKDLFTEKLSKILDEAEKDDTWHWEPEPPKYLH